MIQSHFHCLKIGDLNLTNFDVVFNKSFKNCIKNLKKRFPSVKKDVKKAIEILLQNPKLGIRIPGGHDVRKLRLKNSDLKRGKSGGYRLLYFFEKDSNNCLYFLFIYSKSDKENVTKKEIEKLICEIH